MPSTPYASTKTGACAGSTIPARLRGPEQLNEVLARQVGVHRVGDMQARRVWTGEDLIVLCVGIDDRRPGHGVGAARTACRRKGHHQLIVVLRIHLPRQDHLFSVADARDPGLFAGLREDRKQDRCEIAIIAITTSNSISVKPLRDRGEPGSGCILPPRYGREG